MADQIELSSSTSGGQEDQIERDAEKAYRNLSVEARVVGNLVAGVDDEEFEKVWEEDTRHNLKTSQTKPEESTVESREEESSVSRNDSLSTDSKPESLGAPSGVHSRSSSAGFKTVSLTALPGSRLRISRATSGSSSEVSHSSSEACPSVTTGEQDSVVMAAVHMKPRGLAGSGKPHLPKIGGHVNSLEQAQAEWKLVENLQKGEGEAITRSPEVSFSEALEHFRSCDYLEQYMSHIKPTIRHRGCASLIHALFGPPRMKRHLHGERNLVFALALCVFDNDVTMHNYVLQTIYKQLAGTKLDCPRYGNHWEVVGFQGMDPSTDLRGCGFLGLMNILYILSDPQTHALARNIYKLSQHETQNFPFSVMSINVTRIALQTLREGRLNRECNFRDKVFEVFNEFYAGVFYLVYTVWKTQRKRISDSGFVLCEVEKYCKSHTTEVLWELSKTVSDKKVTLISEESATSPRHDSEKLESFSGVCDIQEREDDEVHLV